MRTGDGGVCILAIGKLLAAAEKAAETLAEEGVEVTVLDVRCCAPLDDAMLADAARHSIVVTCEDGIREGGIGMTIEDLVQHHDANPARRRASPSSACRRSSCRTPSPIAIIAQLGLDADGHRCDRRSLVGA